ncbi:stage III sporulation protein AC [Clostridium tyrobutyricum]|jgi:stage III sporulation protein AC|uniref:Stage III sporulation protein AC n=1 Tax=Clostridium tyrobutyricum DIVETGP TaxID=1408889 RepID=W6N2H4_CLOTY|nr:stage III sporulation protein AC [Clostridium tyrobutyricum]AND85212.1 stage III sporulation protein AC [Clostridium tyrobutyricum]ANP69769.1 stage III sporulation protein AC [Clostridium tyrobutyricum]MBR9646916.1 stage III sporulation protein AC [Clostridium tyrobutyricum]MBV4415215.1 stage III sporulation protein AC [Clostridium tyrobutyricum]MBV4420886.1 stage III sporulation protein AC [Clostridium tyrobutyricum]
MLDISLIFKIAAVGIVVIVINKVLETSGKSEYAVVINIVGIVIVLTMVVTVVNKLFTTVRTMFQF